MPQIKCGQNFTFQHFPKKCALNVQNWKWAADMNNESLFLVFCWFLKLQSRPANPVTLMSPLYQYNLNCSISINFSLPIYCETKAQFSYFYKEVNPQHGHCITKCKMRNVGQQTFSNVTINNKSVILPTLYCLLYLLTLGKNRLEFPPTTIANM